MSQRPPMTVSSIGSTGMPIFQSSGLVPLHNATYSVPPMSSHSKASQPSLSAIATSSAGSSQGKATDIPFSRLIKPVEASGASSAGSTPLSGSPALAKLLQMGNPRPSGGKSGHRKDWVQPAEERFDGSQGVARDFKLNSGRISGTHENPFITKLPSLAMDYPSTEVQPAANLAANPPAGWLSHAQSRAFKPVTNAQILTSADRKASPRPDELAVQAKECLLRAGEQPVGADDLIGGLKSDARASRGVTSIKRDGDTDPVKLDCDTKEWHTKKMEKDEDEEEGREEWVTLDNNPFNMRIVNLNNFPVTQSVYRTNYRSHSVACVRAKLGSIQNTAKSLDLLRQILQKSINAEIDVIIKKYLTEYFQPALENIRLNNGDNAVSSEHVNNVCRQILEEAKKMFNADPRSTTPDLLDNASDSGSTEDVRVPRLGRGSIPPRKRKLSSGSESSSNAPKMKKKGRFGAHLQTSSGRSTPSKKLEPVRREGPLWDSERIKSDTLFVMGARANKALGLGATRGRIYIKHPEVFKYCGDQDDKQWLYEKHLMPATGGKTYLLLVEDIRELAQSDEYRNSPGLLLDELVGFNAPEWMLEKMRNQMNAMRTDTYKGSHMSRESTATESLPRPSPANSDIHEMSTEHDFEDDSRAVSPLNETGGFNQQPSPAPSQAPSELTNADESDDDAPVPGSLYVA